MRILVFSAYFYPHRGGSERYMEELYAQAITQDSTLAVDVICYNTEHAPPVEKYRGMTIYRIACKEILPDQFVIPNYIALMQTGYSLFASRTINAIHSNTRFFDHSWWVPLLAAVFRIPSILTDHTSYHPVHPSKFVTVIARFIDRFVALGFARLYSHVTVSNIATERFLRAFAVKKPRVFYPGVDTKQFLPKKTRHSRLYVTFLGRFVASKKPDLVLAVMRSLLPKYPNVRFIMAGDGPISLKLHRPSPRLTFAGSLNKKQVAQLLAKTDIFVHTNVHEGLPTVVLEAGAAGCAVVTTGAPEVITHGMTGLVVKPDTVSITAALERLINSPSLRLALSIKLRKKILDQFEGKTIAKAFLNFLHE